MPSESVSFSGVVAACFSTGPPDTTIWSNSEAEATPMLKPWGPDPNSIRFPPARRRLRHARLSG
jgi:hypothetical protein